MEDAKPTESPVGSAKSTFGIIGEVNGKRHSDPDYLSTPAPPSISAGVPPCSTLFVGNLHPEVTEADLVQLFSLYARTLFFTFRISFLLVEFLDSSR